MLREKSPLTQNSISRQIIKIEKQMDFCRQKLREFIASRPALQKSENMFFKQKKSDTGQKLGCT